MKYKSKIRFSTTVTVDGNNIYVLCDKGATVDLDEHVAALVNNDIGVTVLTPAKPGKKVRTAQVTEGNTR